MASNCYQRVIVAAPGPVRWITTSNAHRTCLYALLDVPRDATQADIKSAYYKLSKLYHPDKNNGNADASQKFRSITEAYDILGDVKKRSTYDQNNRQGRQSTIFNASTAGGGSQSNDDAQTRFYKQQMRQSHRATMTGRSKIYNYDEWTRNHYSELFGRKQRWMRERDYKNVFEYSESKPPAATREKGKVAVIIFVLMVIIAEIGMSEARYNLDRVKPPDKS